jgi:hypothetical protein
MLQICVVLAQSYNPPARTSRLYLMGRLMSCRRSMSSLSRSALEDMRVRPDGDYDGRAIRRYLFNLIAHSLQLRPMGHVVALELSCARRRELVPRGHVMVSVLSWALVAGAGATRHVAASELPYARGRELRDTRACVPILSFILTWSLYVGVSGLQGTDTPPLSFLAASDATSPPRRLLWLHLTQLLLLVLLVARRLSHHLIATVVSSSSGCSHSPQSVHMVEYSLS